MKYPFGQRPKTIVCSMGDPNGIGPEVLLKTLELHPEWRESLLIVGHFPSLRFHYENTTFANPEHNINLKEHSFSFTLKKISHIEEFVPSRNEVSVLEIHPEAEISPHLGKLEAMAGKLAMLSVEAATHLCIDGKAAAIVTAPINKAAIHAAGYDFPGHTEFLAKLCHTNQVLMMLVSDTLRVALCTIHIPLRNVAGSITHELIISKLKQLSHELTYKFGIEHPKIAVLGLNPHAGDEGVLGTEEQEIIIPALKEFNTSSIATADGPFPADGFFANSMYKQFDAVLAMYHDQGLIPFKTISFNDGVNYTGGLPIIRTSPDHGTAFSIVGTLKAKPDSFAKAVKLAIDLALYYPHVL